MRFLRSGFWNGGKRGLTLLAATAVIAGSLRAADFVAEDAVADAMPLVQRTYRAIHEHPELGLQEHATHDRLMQELTALGLTRFETVAKLPTAVIAVWDSGRPGPTIVLRAEMDARPTQETANNDPRSQIDGVMHNCGHDAHAAMVLGAAQVITRHPEAFTGQIIFLFQPAEEIRGGADDIVADGILKRLGVQAVFAQHVAPNLPVGTVSFTSGSTLAGSNYFTITLRGKGSHAAVPFEGADLPLVAAKVTEALASFSARRLDVLNRPAVVSVTQIETGSAKALNVVPNEATVAGTIRAFMDVDEAAPEGGPSVRAQLTAILDGLTAAYGATYDFKLRKGSPPTRNDVSLERQILPAVNAAWPGVLQVSTHRGMFAEDFSYYTGAFPCLYFGLGVTGPDGPAGGVHSAEFALDPDALAVGTRWLVELAQAAGATLPAQP
ncbi:M20 metallopeptidase family protein [Actomonas aquatica]|uniref:M20 family metallopeptidase n=1 Tax=Actomonas aquatica TaxID=2866162 RepID=A0ABZ1C406_9BACT|nr:M20 family metallopeptidase [Opitutus sp. WL0086]WRQ86028.1 M20 family metallopeptidase [Opitutus sp. WL0086]